MTDRANEVALRRICARRGPYSRDPQEHAENVILAMVNLARYALGYGAVNDIDDAEKDLPPEPPEEE